ncbi:MAG TPA: YceI family protein [Acidimicrobiia bacterium]|jgi:polyisoprenoid-binding protein YceI
MSDLSQLAPGTWNIDPSHSTVGFTVRHLMISKVRGRFGTFSGSLTIDADPLQSSVQATVDLASVNTDDEGRDAHLRGADFFNTETHPEMTFSSTGVKEKGDDYVLLGDLTIKGVTRPVEFELEFEGVGADPWGGTRAGFSAHTEIARKDWNIDFNMPLETGGVVVGEKVKIELEIEAVKA